MFKKNMGKFDRTLRLLLMAAIVVLYFKHVITGTFGIILMIVAGVLLLTSLISFCPLYLPFGISTSEKKKCCCDHDACN
jgi:hypothetical protein